MTPERALQYIRAHQRIANDPQTRPNKRAQHLAAVRYLRAQFNIPEPAITKAVPTTDFERLRARTEPHTPSKPDWTIKQRYLP